jgi:hypothetical protein
MSRRVLLDAGTAALGCLVALAVGELLVRSFAPQHRALSVALRGLHRLDPDVGYVMVPGFQRRVHTPEFTCDVRTNALGLYDRELAPPSPGQRRILVLGDSFTLGVHAGALDSCFVEQLERELGAEARGHTDATGRRVDAVECVNAGVDGFGTEQEVALLARLAPVVQPDAVMLAFYLGNDFTDNSGRTRMTVLDGYQTLAASAAAYRAADVPWHQHVRVWLHAHSELYLLLKRRLFHPLRTRAGAPTPKTTTTAQPFDYFRFDKGFADAMRAKPSDDLQRGMDATRTALQELQRICAARGMTALVVEVPAEQQVDPAARAAWLARFGLDASELDFGLPNRRLAELARAAGLAVYDLTPAFAAAIQAGARPYLRGDPHWNAAGHALAAHTLAAPALEHLIGVPAPVVGRH